MGIFVELQHFLPVLSHIFGVEKAELSRGAGVGLSLFGCRALLWWWFKGKNQQVLMGGGHTGGKSITTGDFWCFSYLIPQSSFIAFLQQDRLTVDNLTLDIN